MPEWYAAHLFETSSNNDYANFRKKRNISLVLIFKLKVRIIFWFIKMCLYHRRIFQFLILRYDWISIHMNFLFFPTLDVWTFHLNQQWNVILLKALRWWWSSNMYVCLLCVLVAVAILVHNWMSFACVAVDGQRL